MKQIIKIIIFALIFAVAAPHTFAQVVSDDMVVKVHSNERSKIVKISNVSKNTPLRITPHIYEIINPGTREEKRIESDDIAVFPAQLILRPRAMEHVRFIFTNEERNLMKVYKVIFTPEKLVEETFTPSAKVETNINVLTSVGILTLLYPEEINEELEWQRDDSGITFANKSNIDLSLKQFVSCSFGQDCIKAPGRRLYPGNVWRLDLPEAMRYEDLELEYYGTQQARKIRVPYATEEP